MEEKLINTYIFEIKKSKFIGYYYEVSSQEEAENIIKKIKEDNKKARHVVYAYKVGPIIKKTDDKEPKNTAGMPIYNVILRNNLDNKLIVIVRYFGGTLLGVGPLTRSYSTVANEVIK